MQQQFAMMGVMHGGEAEVDDRLVAQCDTEQAAYRLCITCSKVHRSQESIAELMGMSKGAFNAILNSDYAERKRYMGRTQQILLEQICQNTVVSQWDRLYRKGLLNCQRSKEDRAAELRAELARLEGVA